MLQAKKGFSLLELLLVIAIFSVIVGMSANIYTGYKGSSDIEADLSSVSSAVKTARIRAATGENFSDWGVHFDKSGADHFFEIFSGASYPGTIEETIYLSDFTRFGDFKSNGSTVPGNTFDVQFKKIAGDVLDGEDKEVEIVLKGGQVNSKTIKINKNGVITSL